MSKGRFLYGVLPKKRRRIINTLGCIGVIFSIGAISLGLAAIITGGSILLACTGILFGCGGGIFAYTARTREFRIYENGISYPKSFGRLFLPLSDILEIKLNTRQEEYIPEIEIILKDSTTLKYSKPLIYNWGEFYRVMLKELKDKVKVVE